VFMFPRSLRSSRSQACVGWSKAFVTVTVLFTLIDGTSRLISANLSCDSVVYSCLMTKMRPCSALVPPSWIWIPSLVYTRRWLRVIITVFTEGVSNLRVVCAEIWETEEGKEVM
jgi:hypothetical protein